MKRILCLSVVASVLVALAAGAARADVDAEVPLALKAKGSLNGEVDVYRFWAARGTLLSLKFAASRRHHFSDIGVALDDPDSNPVPLPAGTVDLPAKIQFKGFELPLTGWYRLDVFGEGFGDYTLDLKGKVKTLWKGESDLTGGDVVLDVAAPAGSTAALKAKRKKGSLATPRWAAVTATGYAADLTALGKSSDTSHAAPAGPFPAGGEIDATLHDLGGGGAVLWQVKFKAPKVKTKKLDLRAKILGRTSGAETMVIRTVDETGGVVSVQSSDSDLYGASVTLPADALTGPTAISIASTDPIEPPSGDDQAAGPAVDLGPGGTFFAGDVTVTLPFDDTLLPVGKTADDIRVLIVEDDGTSQVVDPDSFDTGTVTLTTNTFSICIPIVRVGIPRLGLDPGGDEYWLLQLEAELFPDAGDDSRTRTASVGLGQVSFFGDYSFQYSVTRREISWQNNDSGGSPPITSGLQYAVETDTDDGSATWSYGTDGQTVLLPGQEPVFRPSRDGSVMFGRREGDPAATGMETHLLVRKNLQPLTTSSLNGVWHVALWGMEVGQTGTTGAAEPKPSRGTGTFAFDGIGGCKIAATERGTVYNDSNGSYSTVSQSISVTNGTYAVDGVGVPGTILVTIPPGSIDEEGAVLRFFPGTGLDVMVGSHRDDGDEPQAFVLVRQGTGMGTDSLDGPYLGVEFGVDPNVYNAGAGPGVNILDFSMEADLSKTTFNGGSSATIDFFEHSIQRNSGQAGGLQVDDGGLVTPSESLAVSVSVTSVGKLTFSAQGGSVVGAVAPGGQFAVYVSNPSNGSQNFGMGFLVKAPPLIVP